MGKAKEVVVQRYCIICELPLERKKHESTVRYNRKKTHAGACSKQYMQENHLGFFYGRNHTAQTAKSSTSEEVREATD